MKVLVASRGTGPQDFAHGQDGELVYAADVCAEEIRSMDPDDADSIGACGCSRAWTGVTSRKATTVAEVRDLPITAEQLRELVGPVAARDPVEHLLEVAGRHSVGTRLRHDFGDEEVA